MLSSVSSNIELSGGGKRRVGRPRKSRRSRKCCAVNCYRDGHGSGASCAKGCVRASKKLCRRRKSHRRSRSRSRCH